MDKVDNTKPSEPAINTSKWGWFSVYAWNKKTNDKETNKDKNVSPVYSGRHSSNCTEAEFEVIQQELASASKSYTATASYEHTVLVNNLEQKINDQYINLNEYGTTKPIKPIDDDDKKPINNNVNVDDKTVENHIHSDDAVMISQTLTLKTRNEELEKERDALHSETLQLRMETQCLRQTNQHIIDAQQREMEKLQSNKQQLTQSLKRAQEEIASLKRERNNLQKKLRDICGKRLNNDNIDINSNDNVVFVSDEHVIYGCIQCGQHLFDSSALIQRKIEIEDNTFGLLVDGLIGNNNDVTMGPTVCKTFINEMFKVKEVFCDGCLSTFGWKICESFDDWNEFYSNKFCVDIAAITQISIAAIAANT